MLNMKMKKPMKPTVEIPEMTDDAGLSSPNHPARTPTSRPSQPIHRGSARVVRMATAYSGMTTPQPTKFPAALVTSGGEGVGGSCQRGLPCRVSGDVGGYEFVGHRDWD